MGIHDYAQKVGLDSDVFVATALINMYMKCGVLDESRDAFDEMQKRDVVAWKNAMIAGFLLHGLYDDTMAFLLEMQRTSISPNPSTAVGLLPVIGQAKALKEGKTIHGLCLSEGLSERRCFGLYRTIGYVC